MTTLVTGGSGFLGFALCQALRKQGLEVRSLQRRFSSDLQTLGVTQICADLTDRHAVFQAVDGVQSVFHNAAKAGAWGPYRAYYQANVVGTQHVIEACQAHRVQQLIYTSTPSVTHAKAKAVQGLSSDDVPYGKHFTAAYPATKAIAEQAVLTANNPKLATIALRPRLIWGPGDHHLLPQLIKRAQAGHVQIIGNGRNLVDSTFITNAVHAHLAAFTHLSPDAPCAGRAYFISNGEPRPIATLITQLLAAVGISAQIKTCPFPLGYALAAACEWLWQLLPLAGEPPLTRFLAEQLSTAHWYSMTSATRDFGYQPQISIDQGLALLAADDCRIKSSR